MATEMDGAEVYCICARHHSSDALAAHLAGALISSTDFLTLCLCLCLYLSVSLSLCLSVFVSVFVALSLSLCLFPHVTIAVARVLAQAQDARLPFLSSQPRLATSLARHQT